MSKTYNQDHPDLDTLLAFADHRLTESESEGVEKHLESCTQCRLEIKRYNRFNELGEDPADAQDAQWDQAELELQRSWRENIQPAIAGERKIKRPSRRRTMVWMVSAAAAAVAAVIMMGPLLTPGSFSPPEVSEVVRGAEEDAESAISLESPSGELKVLPEEFIWESDVECEDFRLEIFTSDLKTVWVESELEKPRWEMTEEVALLLESETIYVWNVRGFNELKLVAESGNNWFRFFGE